MALGLAQFTQPTTAENHPVKIGAVYGHFVLCINFAIVKKGTQYSQVPRQAIIRSKAFNDPLKLGSAQLFPDGQF